jgi:transcriptional regulator with XRE-family HTH domain
VVLKFYRRPLIKPFHVQRLASELQRRKERNCRYSLRAFATFLEIDPSALSRILAGKQELSVQVALQLIQRLELSAEEREKFISSVADVKYRNAFRALASPVNPAPKASPPPWNFADFRLVADKLAQPVVVLRISSTGEWQPLFINLAIRRYHQLEEASEFSLPPDDCSRIKAECQKALLQQKPYRGHIRFRCRDQVERRFEVEGSPSHSDPACWVFVAKETQPESSLA